MKNEIKRVLSERVNFVLNDARTYIYVRREGLLAAEGLGGGNFATAYAVFALLNLLSKVHYFLHSPAKFVTNEQAVELRELKNRLLEEPLDEDDKKLIRKLQAPKGMYVNETDAFIAFARELESKGVTLHRPRLADHEDFSTIWDGFRNMLSHLVTVQDGKGISTFEIEQFHSENTGMSTSVNEILLAFRRQLATYPAFVFDESRSGWIMHSDSLVAVLEDVRRVTIECIDASELSEVELDRLLNFMMPA